MADPSPQFPHRPDHHRKEEDRSKGQPPIDLEKHGEEDEQTKPLAKGVREVLGESQSRAFDVIYDRGNQASRRLVLEEPDGLTDELGIELIAEIVYGRVADRLNQEAASKFRNGFGKEHDQKCDGDNRPHIVDGSWKELIEVDSMIGKWNPEQFQSGVACGGIQKPVKNQRKD